MNDSIITAYVISQLGCKSIEYGRMDWVWTDGTGTALTMELDKQNSIDGILILNFGVSIPGAGGTLTIVDQKAGNWLVYRSSNTLANEVVSPFLYFTKGNNLKFASNINLVYGFNYITVRKKE